MVPRVPPLGAICGRAQRKGHLRAPSPLLSKLLILYSLAATDRKASQRLPALLGFTGCPSALPSVRKAIARVLGPFMKRRETLLPSDGRGH